MSKPVKEFVPELSIEPNEQAALVLTVASEGYRVIHKLIKHRVDTFILALINVSSTEEKAVLEAHRVAKVAARMYDGITEEINFICQDYSSGRKVDTIQPDSTEGVIDFGPPATTQDQYETATEEGLL